PGGGAGADHQRRPPGVAPARRDDHARSTELQRLTEPGPREDRVAAPPARRLAFPSVVGTAGRYRGPAPAHPRTRTDRCLQWRTVATGVHGSASSLPPPGARWGWGTSGVFRCRWAVAAGRPSWCSTLDACS